MSDDIKVGDVCEIVEGYPEFVGRECTVISNEYQCPCCGDLVVDIEVHGYTVPPPYVGVNARKSSLRKKPPRSRDDAEPRADFTPGDWDLMPWRPGRTKVDA